MIRKLAALLAGRPAGVEKHPAFADYGTTPAARALETLMRERYTVDRLVRHDPAEFQRYIESLPGSRDWQQEGFDSPEHQRDHTIQFDWGHDHDFGTFAMQGAMGRRHLDILATFMAEHGQPTSGAPAAALAGKRVLDIGCWTGGTSLLLAAMGAEVFAIEEVQKYADCVTYLADAFGIDRLEVARRSLYSLDDPAFFDRFDIVLYSGVLYHVTDPVLSLRIVFNALKDGGVCLLETMGIDRRGRYCEYQGARRTLDRDGDGALRSDWNWFVPTLDTVRHMTADAGFAVERATFHHGGRILAVARRVEHQDILRAGLAVPGIR